jgi:hypothetical protein
MGNSLRPARHEPVASHRDGRVWASVGLGVEGAALVVGRGNCPVGPLQAADARRRSVRSACSAFALQRSSASVGCPGVGLHPGIRSITDGAPRASPRSVRRPRALVAGLADWGIGMHERRRTLVTGSAAAIFAWVVFLAVLWWAVSPR